MSTTNDSSVSIPSSVQAATFSPSPFNLRLNESLQNIPKCLMRVTDPESPGRTTEKEVCSPASQDPRATRDDLYKTDTKTAAEALRAHLWWDCCTSGIGIKCDLVSWTSSMLCALQYALFRHHYHGHNLSDIKILLVDTKQLSGHVFARDLQAIAAFKGPSTELRSLDKLYDFRSTGRYFTGEYLSQGRLIIDTDKATQVSMETLVDRGLFKICPGLADEVYWGSWPTRMNILRNEMQQSSSLVQAADVRTAIHIGEAWGHFQLDVVTMILSMTPHDVIASASIILGVLLEVYTERQIQQTVNLKWSIGDTEFLPEVERRRALLERFGTLMAVNINEIQQKSDALRKIMPVGNDSVEDLLEGVGKLEI